MGDLLPILLGLLIWPVVIFSPGYAASLLLNPLDANKRSLAHRLLIALPLSLGIVPVGAYLIWRFAGLIPVLALLSLCGVVTASHLAMHAHAVLETLQKLRFFVLAAVVWLIGAVVMMLPVQVNSKLFMAVMWIDYAKHVAVTDTLSRTGVPPAQPYFYPGESRPIFYYYGWFVQSSLVDLLGGNLVSPDHAVVSGIIWTGLAMAACLLLLAKHIVPSEGIDLKRRYQLVILLMLVTGLDVIPTLGRNIPLWLLRANVYNKSVEWWNEQIAGWIDMLLWVPQHVSGAISGMLGLMLIRYACRQNASRLHILMAGMCFASSVLMSVYLGLVTALLSGAWIAVSLLRRRTPEAAAFAGAGVIATILASVFVLELHAARFTEGSPLAISVRAFGPVDTLLRNSPYFKPLILQPLYLVFLPLNYAIEFGFFALAAWMYWQMRKKTAPEKRDDDWFLITWLITIGIFASFVRSAISLNDLGWRSFIPVQAVLLIWAADAWQRRELFSGRMILAARILLIIGVASTAYDLWLLRSSSIQDHLRKVPSDDVALAYDVREAHRWIDRNAPASAVVQYRPLADVGYLHGNFGRRQVAIGDPVYGPIIGIPGSIYEPWRMRVDEIFASPTVPATTAATLEELKVHYLLLLSTDPIWASRDSLGEKVYEQGRCAVVRVAYPRD